MTWRPNEPLSVRVNNWTNQSYSEPLCGWWRHTRVTWRRKRRKKTLPNKLMTRIKTIKWNKQNARQLQSNGYTNREFRSIENWTNTKQKEPKKDRRRRKKTDMINICMWAHFVVFISTLWLRWLIVDGQTKIRCAWRNGNRNIHTERTRIAVTVRVTSYVARLVDAADDGSYPKHTIL